MNDLARGTYEREEATTMTRHLVLEDRLLELGAGIGFMTCKAAQILPAEQITAVEANPALLPIIRNNFALNGCADVALLHGAVTSGPDAPDGVFYVGPNFTAASTSKVGRGNFREISVPVLDFAVLLERAAPTVVVMDVEGGELELAEVALPESVRLVIMEVHRDWLGDTGIRVLFDRMHAQGFVYTPEGSNGAVVCFARIDATTGRAG
ncbi:MAG: FkbM family methyltransferase [Pseudomonadota bacterium]